MDTGNEGNTEQSENSGSEVRDVQFRDFSPKERFDTLNRQRVYGTARGRDFSDGNTGNESNSSSALEGSRRGRSGRSYGRQENKGNQEFGGKTVVLVPTPVETKEENMNNQTILPVPVTGYGFGGYGGAPVAAPIAAPVGAYEGYGSWAILQSLTDIATTVKDAECSTKDAIMVSNSQRQTAELSLHNRLCESEKEAIKAGFAAVTATKDAESRLLSEMKEGFCDIRSDIKDVTINVNEKFCDLEHNLDRRFDAIERREDKREIHQLRDQLAQAKESANDSNLAATIINALKD